MASETPHLRNAPDLVVLPEHREALLRQLGAQPTSWGEIAALVMHTPGLLHPLFRTMPLSRQRLGAELKCRIIDRLKILGEDLLKTWLLTVAVSAHAEEASREAQDAARRMAELARQLALETAYPYPDEAYLVGLWHNLADQLNAVPAPPSGADDPDARICAASAELAAACALPLPAIDALTIRLAEPEYVMAAHPLARLLWSADQLSRLDWEARLVKIEKATGMSAHELAILRKDVWSLCASQALSRSTTLSAEPSADVQGGNLATLETFNASGLLGNTLREAAIGGLIRNAFNGLDAEQARARLGLSCGIFSGLQPSLLIVEDNDQLWPLPLTPDNELLSWYAELGQRTDDETSAIARAIRTGTPTSRLDAAGRPGRSIGDWQIGRWLGVDGFICLPMSLTDCAGAVVIAAGRHDTRSPDATQMLTTLATAAADASVAIRRQQARQKKTSDDIEHRYREHARRIAHEASNPLTVIKSYLGLISQRHPEAAALNEEMRIVQSELDRIGLLIEKAAAPPEDAPEPAFCHLTELLHDLRAIYGEALFGNRGIHFELRTLGGLPAVAMPASALRQVLLNLLRNAAEILHPGGRCTVALAGQLLINGTHCLEIRVIDNGPGLPPERMTDLFSPRPSAKGGKHQGVGLSIVNEILTQWQASILCRSQEGTGTSFQLLVPIKNSG